MKTYYVNSEECKLTGQETLSFFADRILDKEGVDVTNGVPAKDDLIIIRGEYPRSIRVQWVEIAPGGFVIHSQGQHWLDER